MGASGVERINVSGGRHGCFAVIQMTDLQIIYTILVSFVLVFFCMLQTEGSAFSNLNTYRVCASCWIIDQTKV